MKLSDSIFDCPENQTVLFLKKLISIESANQITNQLVFIKLAGNLEQITKK